VTKGTLKNGSTKVLTNSKETIRIFPIVLISIRFKVLLVTNIGNKMVKENYKNPSLLDFHSLQLLTLSSDGK